MPNLIEELGLDVDNMDVEQLCDAIDVHQEYAVNDEAEEQRMARDQAFTGKAYNYVAAQHVEDWMQHQLKDFFKGK
jgi:hypothetical protein